MLLPFIWLLVYSPRGPATVEVFPTRSAGRTAVVVLDRVGSSLSVATWTRTNKMTTWVSCGLLCLVLYIMKVVSNCSLKR